jgi:hypothetical protein
VTLVSGLGSGLAFAFGALRRGFFVGREAAGGSVGRGLGGDGGGELEELKRDDDGVLVSEGEGLIFGERASSEGVEELGIEFGVGFRIGDGSDHANEIWKGEKSASPRSTG